MNQATLPLEAPAQPYDGSLKQLMGLLTDEASRKPHGTWCWRQLPRGALVCLQVDDDNRRILRIAREKRPEGERGLKLWASEIATFLRFFGAERWESLPAEDAIGIAARFRELFPQEHRAGFTRCTCGAELPFDKIWGTPPCPSCEQRGVEP